MIEDEVAFRNYLIYKKSRKLKAETAESYIDYLNSVTKCLGVNITRWDIDDYGAIKNLIFGLKARKMNEGSIRNCQSALKAYLYFTRYGTQNGIFPEEVETYVEGAVTSIKVNKYERDYSARIACINHYKPICTVCKFDFFSVYGAIGEGFIHVHHIVPLSEIGKRYTVNPITDLVPVCPNCHAMLHKKNPPFTINELIEIISK